MARTHGLSAITIGWLVTGISLLAVLAAASTRDPEVRAVASNSVAVRETPSVSSGPSRVNPASSAVPRGPSLDGWIPSLFSAAPSPGPSSVESSPTVASSLETRNAIDAMKAQLRRNDLPGALHSLEALAQTSQDIGRQPEVREAIVDLSQRITALRNDAPARFFSLLSDKMGPAGIDILYYLVTAKGSSDAARFAGDLLKQTQVASRGSAAMQVAWALRSASTCEDKRALFDKAGAVGDSRSYGQLALLDNRCGRRSNSCCMPNDPQLKATLAAMRARGVE